MALGSSSSEAKTPNKLLGYIAAGLVVFIWATWLVVSRSGAQTVLTVYDLAVIRYGVSAIAALPFVLYFKPWQTISLPKMLCIAFLLGPTYILCVFQAFVFAPAAHGGIFMNGALPAMTLLIGWIWLSEKISLVQAFGILMILVGTVLAVIDGAELAWSESWKGDLLFLFAAVFFAGYLVVGRLWKVTSTQVLLSSSIINAILYVPIWLLFLPSGIDQANYADLTLQLVFQGLVPTLGGLLLVAYALRTIGSAPTAAFMAAVPSLATLLSALWLGEFPGVWGWISIAVITPGILLVALVKRTKVKESAV